MNEEDVRWVVNDLGELGVCVQGQYFFLYKGESLEYGKDYSSASSEQSLHDDGTPMMVRPVGKREFGETCKPITCMKVENGVLYDRTPIPYRQELTFTPGLSDGKRGDADWRPLPAAGKQTANEPTAAPELPAMLDRWAKWILDTPPSYGGDYVCAQCCPESEIIRPVFVCAYHEAEGWISRRTLSVEGAAAEPNHCRDESKPTFQWHGNMNDKTGVAEYKVGEYEYAILLDSFSEAINLYGLLQCAYNNGINNGREKILRAIKKLAEDAAEM